MKCMLYFVSFFMSLTLFAESITTEKMAVFPNNTVFTLQKAVIPENQDSFNFFTDRQFFKGSFAVWSNDVLFSVQQRPKKRFNANVFANINAAFADRHVLITLKSYGKEENIISGKVIKIENPDNPFEIADIIAVQDTVSKKITYINKHDIKTVCADNADFMNDIYPASCWIFSRKNGKKALPFEFSYLTDGIEWQSEIELHLKSKDKMDIIHNAVICNNGEKFDCADFYLVSGSPEISTRNVRSLLCRNGMIQTSNYRTKFAQNKAAAFMSNEDSMAASDSMNAYSFISQSSDVLYRHLGKFAMDKGERRLLKLQFAQNVPYRTAAKWVIPARRNVYGKALSNHAAQNAENTLIFKNLCPSMLDSAPIAIYADGKLMMISNLYSNTPVNAERSIRLSKADGIECKIEENELVKSRIQNVIFNNRRYVKCTIEAVLKIRNFRKDSAFVVIDYNFNGEYVKCDGANGKLTQQTSASSILNPRSTLGFEFELPPATTKELKVTYTVLTTL